MNERFITKQLRCKVDGREWRLFTADYKADGATYSLEFYAISSEHASAIVEDIKETLTLTGELVGSAESP